MCDLLLLLMLVLLLASVVVSMGFGGVGCEVIMDVGTIERLWSIDLLLT